jgi:DNA polymerase-3 subunit epsilon
VSGRSVAASGFLALVLLGWGLIAFLPAPERLPPGIEPAGAMPPGVLAGMIWAAAIGGFWLVIDRMVFAALLNVGREMRFLAQTKGASRALVLPGRHLLGDVIPALNDVAELIQGNLEEQRKELDRATQKSEDQKRWLEVILVDLSEGILVCNLNHQMLLYNQVAAKLFNAPEAVGLGRPLFALVTRAAILHTLDLLEHRGRKAGQMDATAPFICATADSRLMLQGRMGLIQDASGKTTAYVLTFTDISQHIIEIAQSDAVRRALTRDLRRPVANILAAAETLNGYPGMPAETRASFEKVVLDESSNLSERLQQLALEYRGHALGRWPMGDIHASDLFACLERRLRAATGIELTLVGIPLWLQGDSHLLLLAIENLVKRVSQHAKVSEFDAETMLGDRRVYLDLAWMGPAIPSVLLDQWLEEPLESIDEPYTLKDVMDRHGSEMWSQPASGGRSILRIPLLAPAGAPVKQEAEPLPPRPEFYDFGLLREHSDIGKLGDKKLKDLRFVVFDTETTGLKPSEGDEIISIGAVRVVNGRMLTGETFERLVNPGRTIPPESIRFHHITDEMVKDKPPISIVLPQFKKFAGEEILVAHNAAFDLKFLQMQEKATGVRFANPVLDTLLLSRLADEHLDNHSLDSIASRFVIDIPNRHTALGDALATGAVLVKLIEILEAKGIETFGDVMRRSNMVMEMKINQTRF